LSDDEPQSQPGDDERSAAQPSDVERELLALGQNAPRKRTESKPHRIERERREADVFWGGVLADPVGRRELWRIIAGAGGAHAFETQFPAGQVGFPDPNAAWYARGEQDFGLRLYHALLVRNAHAVALMHQENDTRFQSSKSQPSVKQEP